jgi:hypothetical protein
MYREIYMMRSLCDVSGDACDIINSTHAEIESSGEQK